MQLPPAPSALVLVCHSDCHSQCPAPSLGLLTADTARPATDMCAAGGCAARFRPSPTTSPTQPIRTLFEGHHAYIQIPKSHPSRYPGTCALAYDIADSLHGRHLRATTLTSRFPNPSRYPGAGETERHGCGACTGHVLVGPVDADTLCLLPVRCLVILHPRSLPYVAANARHTVAANARYTV